MRSVFADVLEPYDGVFNLTQNMQIELGAMGILAVIGRAPYPSAFNENGRRPDFSCLIPPARPFNSRPTRTSAPASPTSMLKTASGPERKKPGLPNSACSRTRPISRSGRRRSALDHQDLVPRLRVPCSATRR